MGDQRDILKLVYRLFSSDIGTMSGIDPTGSKLSSAEPLTIYDLSGAKLFLDYELLDSADNYFGFLRSSAKDSELPLIDTICIGPRPFDPNTAIQRAVASAVQRRPGTQVVGVQNFVCYGYPRVGVLVSYQFQGKILNSVFDASIGAFIREWEGVFTPEAGEADEEGEPFYSYLSRIPEAGDPAGDVAKQWAFYTDLQARDNQGIEGGMAVNAIRVVESIANVRVAESGTLLPVSIEGQKTPVFCAVAAAQMMLKYLGIEESQDNIAAVFHTSASGTTNDDFLTGFGSLTGGKWKASINQGPTFESTAYALGGMVPVKSGIPQHARLIRGFKEYIFLKNDGTVAHRDRFFIVDDPWPVNSGQIVLENCAKSVPDFYRNIIVATSVVA